MRTRIKKNKKKFFKIMVFLIFATSTIVFMISINFTTQIHCSNQNLTCESFILVDREGTVMQEKNKEKKMSIASLTKIMTTLCLIEQSDSLEQNVPISESVFSTVYSENLATAGFEPNELVTFRDLLYGIMLPSGAEAALSGAIYMAGNEESFVEVMNRKAQKLGMKNTHFTNVTGLDQPENYSTAHDLVILLDYALKNETFKEIFTSFHYNTQSTAMHSNGLLLNSTLIKNNDTLKFSNGEIIGAKTGYTSGAGQCLATLSCVNDKEYLLISLHSKGDENSILFHLRDQINILSRLSLTQ